MSSSIANRVRDFLAAHEGKASLPELCRHAFALETSLPLARRLLETVLPGELQFDGDRVVWRPRIPGDRIENATFFVVDIETTGTQPSHAEILEFGGVWVKNLAIAGYEHCLLRPARPIPPFIQGLTGITEDMVADAPRFLDQAEKLHGLFQGSVPVAHHADFDFRFLDYAFTSLGLRAVGHNRLCTMKLARVLAPGRKYNLDALAERLGVRPANRHRALGDAQATAEILIALLSRALDQGIETLQQLHQLRPRRGNGAASRLRIGPERVRAIPSAPGIYRFRDHRGEVLYVGKAANLKRRLGSYFVGSPKGKVARMLADMVDFDYTVTGSELEALLEEAREIRTRQPVYNRTLHTWGRYGYLILSSEAFPRLRFSREEDHTRAERYGPFRFPLGGRYELKALRETFGIRSCPGPLKPDTHASPCIEYGMHRCGAPCAHLQDHTSYNQGVEALRAFLQGDARALETLRTSIRQAAAQEAFERAAALRDRYRILISIYQGIRREGAVAALGDRILILPPAEPHLVRLYLLRPGRGLASVRAAIADTIWPQVIEKLLAQPVGQDPGSLQDARIAEQWLRRKPRAAILRVSEFADIASLARAVASAVQELPKERFETGRPS